MVAEEARALAILVVRAFRGGLRAQVAGPREPIDPSLDLESEIEKLQK